MTEPRYIPPNESPRFRAWFEGWCRRNLIGKKFCAVRVERSGAGLLRSLAGHPGPLILAVNHIGWWDPLMMLTIQRLFFPDRSLRAPMDASQLERFKIFRRMGVFGIDPDDPASLGRMSREMAAYFAQAEGPTLWITPQGEFADVRAPLVLRPGVSRLAASTPGAVVVAVSVEYCFWADPKPEVLIAARRVEAPGGTTTAWHRALMGAMEAGSAELAALAIARDASAFEAVVSKEGRQGGVLYDLWLRARGRGGGLGARRAPDKGAHAGESAPPGSVEPMREEMRA